MNQLRIEQKINQSKFLSQKDFDSSKKLKKKNMNQ